MSIHVRDDLPNVRQCVLMESQFTVIKMSKARPSHIAGTYCITANIRVQENFANFANFANSRKFPAREYWKDENTPYLKIREIFLSRNCLWAKFAKFSCREIFLFYSICTNGHTSIWVNRPRLIGGGDSVHLITKYDEALTIMVPWIKYWIFFYMMQVRETGKIQPSFIHFGLWISLKILYSLQIEGWTPFTKCITFHRRRKWGARGAMATPIFWLEGPEYLLAPPIFHQEISMFSWKSHKMAWFKPLFSQKS